MTANAFVSLHADDATLFSMFCEVRPPTTSLKHGGWSPLADPIRLKFHSALKH